MRTDGTVRLRSELRDRLLELSAQAHGLGERAGRLAADVPSLPDAAEIDRRLADIAGMQASLDFYVTAMLDIARRAR